MGNAFGYHLILDCYNCDIEKLSNPEFLKNFLNRLVKEIDMTKMIEPVVKNYGGNDKKDSGGYSGFVMILESHISFHTFPHNKGFITLDIYSCKKFDVEKAVETIVKELKAEKWEQKVIERGLSFQNKNSS